MSLIINSNIETQGGIELSSAYARITVVDGAQGTSLNVNLEYYPTDQAFLNGLAPTRMANDISALTINYDRSTQGTDILMLAHEAAQAVLTDNGITSIIAELN